MCVDNFLPSDVMDAFAWFGGTPFVPTGLVASGFGGRLPERLFGNEIAGSKGAM